MKEKKEKEKEDSLRPLVTLSMMRHSFYDALDNLKMGNKMLPMPP
jgi:hypothetical protein